MNKIQRLDRARVDAQNQMHRAARNFFQLADKNKRNPQVITAAKAKSIDKIKEFQ